MLKLGKLNFLLCRIILPLFVGRGKYWNLLTFYFACEREEKPKPEWCPIFWAHITGPEPLNAIFTWVPIFDLDEKVVWIWNVCAYTINGPVLICQALGKHILQLSTITLGEVSAFLLRKCCIRTPTPHFTREKVSSNRTIFIAHAAHIHALADTKEMRWECVISSTQRDINKITDSANMLLNFKRGTTPSLCIASDLLARILGFCHSGVYSDHQHWPYHCI